MAFSNSALKEARSTRAENPGIIQVITKNLSSCCPLKAGPTPKLHQIIQDQFELFISPRINVLLDQ